MDLVGQIGSRSWPWLDARALARLERSYVGEDLAILRMTRRIAHPGITLHARPFRK